jgi:hypothetical protein
VPASTLTLELGGNDASIVLDDADVDSTVGAPPGVSPHPDSRHINTTRLSLPCRRPLTIPDEGGLVYARTTWHTS